MNIDCAEIADDVRRVIEEHSVREYPAECCGVLVGRIQGQKTVVVQAVEGRNIAEEGRMGDRYVVEPLAIVRAERAARIEGLEVVGFYHSHPNCGAQASATDAASSWERYIYVIASVNKNGMGEMRAWTRRGDNPPEMYEISM